VTSKADTPLLERPEFFDGERMTAADLAAVQGFHRELRWLHSRGLHGWGIAEGYAVTGNKGDRSVRVQPGFALDCYGRELILGESREKPVPPVARSADPYYLTVAYAEDSELRAETREGACGSFGAVRRPEEPRLEWRKPGERRPGLDVVVASVRLRDCKLATPVSPAEREALAVQQPYVAAGRTAPGATPWSYWPSASNPAGVRTTVSTTEAGFTGTPLYNAHVVGERVRGGIPAVTIDGNSWISNATATRFVLSVLLPAVTWPGGVLNRPNVVRSSGFLGQLMRTQGWHVVWMGVEG
jgi:hypothetical protein